MSLLRLQDISHCLNGTQVLRDITLDIQSGECVALVGPNGSGKSTLLRMAYRMLQPKKGNASLYGRDIWHISAAEFARQVAVLAQESTDGFAMSVAETVMLGRLPHQSSWSANSARDWEIVHRSLQQVEALHLIHRRMDQLSGGERQRVRLARSLAQEPQLLILDEPTNHLDIHHQLGLLEQVKHSGCTTLMALHDLNLAAQYCDRIALLHQGQLLTMGTPDAVLTASNLEHVYGVGVVIDRHPITQTPRISYSARRDAAH
ncbi:MAG: ABC transporter ATP-binding protein [Comamonas sp.]|nr:ABC transporter ATP-binding protein [Comamonas sp.]